MFPNPAQSSLTIKVDKPYSKIIVEVIDEKGSIIYKKAMLENPVCLNNVIKGNYLIKLTIDNQTVIKKIIIQ